MASPTAVSEAKARQGAHVIEMQRRRLLSAMVEVLEEHGYEGATVGRICKRAGVSRRTFYDLYDDREECFLDAFGAAIERLGERVASAYWGEAGADGTGGARWAKGTRGTGGARGTRDAHRAREWRERIRAALTALLESLDAEPGLARLCLVETLKAGPEALARRRVVTDVLAAAVDEGRTMKHTSADAKGADPPMLAAESLVGGAIAVIHTRLMAQPGASKCNHRPLVELVNPLMSMIVLPYLGPVASRKELERSVPVSAPGATRTSNGHALAPASDPFRDLPIRITFRTVRVLATIGALGGRGSDPSNREIAQRAGVADQGQMSKLLRRLEKAELVSNHGEGQVRGEPNAWRLTPRGQGVLHVIGDDVDA
jgi:AcrR family transcriptional regulator